MIMGCFAGPRLTAPAITNAYIQGKPLERLLILRVPKQKGVPDPEIQQAGYMIALVPVHGTTDAGRNLYLRIKESCKEFGCKVSQILSALYFITGEDNKLRAAVCTHVDDFLWAATPIGEPVAQQLLDRFKIGRIESDKFRFCGREYVQSADGTIEINCRDNTRAIRPIDVHKSEKGTTPVSNSQRTALRSVVGSLAWVARATRPDLAYRVKVLQQQVVKATVETLRMWSVPSPLRRSSHGAQANSQLLPSAMLRLPVNLGINPRGEGSTTSRLPRPLQTRMQLTMRCTLSHTAHRR